MNVNGERAHSFNGFSGFKGFKDTGCSSAEEEEEDGSAELESSSSSVSSSSKAPPEAEVETPEGVEVEVLLPICLLFSILLLSFLLLSCSRSTSGPLQATGPASFGLLRANTSRSLINCTRSIVCLR
mgnify:CR=1 FL=1